jgi:hypothetical protein
VSYRTGGKFFLYLLQVDLEIARVLISPLRILLQAACNDFVELARNTMPDLPYSLRLIA